MRVGFQGLFSLCVDRNQRSGEGTPPTALDQAHGAQPRQALELSHETKPPLAQLRMLSEPCGSLEEGRYGDSPYGICLEDDIEFNKSAFGQRLLGISGNSFDVIYVNERLSGRFGGRRSSTTSLKVQ